MFPAYRGVEVDQRVVLPVCPVDRISGANDNIFAGDKKNSSMICGAGQLCQPIAGRQPAPLQNEGREWVKRLKLRFGSGCGQPENHRIGSKISYPDC